MIISQNAAGAGNRIKSWIVAMRLSEIVDDMDVRVWWPRTYDVAPIPGTKRRSGNSYVRFSELFKNDCEIDYCLPVTGSPEKNYAFQHDKNIHTYGRARFLIFPEDGLPSDFIKNPSSQYQKIDHQYNRIPKNIRENYVRQFQKIKFQDVILEKVENFPLFSKNTVSVQIRTFCNSRNPRRYNNFNLNNFINAMNEYEINHDFFVCSDNEQIISQLKTLYGDRILTFEKSVPVDIDSKDALIDAMVEILLLSKNNDMILTEESTYSELAWWFGDAQASVKKIGTQTWG